MLASQAADNEELPDCLESYKPAQEAAKWLMFLEMCEELSSKPSYTVQIAITPQPKPQTTEQEETP